MPVDSRIPSPRCASVIVALILGALAGGCGGGGGDSPTVEEPSATPAPVPAPQPAGPGPMPAPEPAPPAPEPTPAPDPAPAPAPRLVSIMALGDSMTAGGEASGSANRTYRSYRGYLDLQLENAGYSVDFVGSRSHAPVDGGDPDHEGYGGLLIGPDNLVPPETDTIYDRVVGNGFASILGPSVDPDFIILALGWNSANYRASDAANQYAHLVATIQSMKPKAKLVLATLSPREGETEAQTEALLPGYRELNAKARGLANASAGDNLLLADLAGGGFQSGDFVAPGDIHWSRPGAMRAASIIYQTLVREGELDDAHRIDL